MSQKRIYDLWLYEEDVMEHWMCAPERRWAAEEAIDLDERFEQLIPFIKWAAEQAKSDGQQLRLGELRHMLNHEFRLTFAFEVVGMLARETMLEYPHVRYWLKLPNGESEFERKMRARQKWLDSLSPEEREVL